MTTGRVVLDTVERYDVLSDRWRLIDGASLPVASYSMTLHPVHNRYIYMLGDTDKQRRKEEESLYRLDTYFLARGWLAMSIKGSPLSCCQNGLIPVG